MKKLTKRANIAAAQAFTLGIAGIAITVAIVLYILSQMNTDFTANSAEKNATTLFITKLGKIPTWIGLLIVVFFAGLVLTYFYMRG